MDEVILRLTSYCGCSLGDLLFDSNIPKGLLDDIASVLAHLQSITTVHVFAKECLPPLVEVLLRRKTHRYIYSYFIRYHHI